MNLDKGIPCRFSGNVEDGEVWDRSVTFNRDTQDAGLIHCLLNLRALVFTAHIVDINQVAHHKSACNVFPPLVIEEKSDWCEKQKITHSCMLLAERAILQALHFYGKYYILYPVGSEAHISYNPYRGDHPVYEGLAEFIIGRHHFPDDHILQRVLETNLRPPKSNILLSTEQCIEVKRNTETKDRNETTGTQECKTGGSNSASSRKAAIKRYRKLLSMDDDKTKLNMNADSGINRFAIAEDPLHTPICFLVTVFEPEN